MGKALGVARHSTRAPGADSAAARDPCGSCPHSNRETRMSMPIPSPSPEPTPLPLPDPEPRRDPTDPFPAPSPAPFPGPDNLPPVRIVDLPPNAPTPGLPM
jgi:hypothetical protein